MINSKKLILATLVGLSSLFYTACSTGVKKADIPATANPQEEIEKLERDLSIASTKNIDVLAANEYEKSVNWLKEAKSDQADKKNQSEILNDLRKSRGYLERAYQISENRAEKAPGLFESRQAAMRAGAARHSSLRSDLYSLDNDVSDIATDLQEVDTQKISQLQGRYMTIERQATVLTELGTSQAYVNGAKKAGAERLAPNTLKKAELSLKNAESVISANVRNPKGYREAVVTASLDANLLSRVIATIQRNGKVSESVALKMVQKDSQIENLSKDLSISELDSAASKRAMNIENQNLTDDLSSANVSVEIQRAMESARQQFTADEAEAYQQGENLLIRLKQMNFASGRSDLPEASLNILAKVSALAQEMNASEIIVEGHTDSIGNVGLNKSLSEKRASAVATYFKSNGFQDVTAVGYGYEKPIATNKSKAGRAQNRRVDVVITKN